MHGHGDFWIAWGESCSIRRSKFECATSNKRGIYELLTLSLDLVILLQVLSCHHFSVHPCCATLNMKPQNTGYYFLFTISILELKNKGNGQVHTLFKMNRTIFLPLTWAIYCSSLKQTSCLQTDITHNSSHCQVLVWGPLRCLKSAIHICAGSPFVYLKIFPWKFFFNEI